MRRSQKETEASARIVTRRAIFAGGLMGLTGAVLAGRMRHLQVERADDFRLLAEDNRIAIRRLPPTRGVIHDRVGRVIAGNEQVYRIAMIREEVGAQLDEVLDRLSRLVRISRADLAEARERLMSLRPSESVTVADRLTWQDISAVAVNAPALPGVTPEVGLSRVYPMEGDFAHVVGYVGSVSDYYLETSGDDDPVLMVPGFQVGRYALENRMERTLRGEAGTKRVEVNAVGRVMRELDRVDPVPGSDLHLTVDAGLQNYVEERLAGESAAAVVMRVDNGEIAALGSAPTFDPNLFVRGISTAEYAALRDNIYRPLASKPVQGLYPPGSTFKMVTALAALDAGVLTPGQTEYCPGLVEVGGRRFHCWRRGGHGSMALVESLSQSCDVFFYEVAQRVGIDNISAMARRLGLGMRHDLPLSGISEGIAPTREWKLRRHGEPWVIGDTLNASIGQGFVWSSPLQLAVMTARLAGGRDVRPQLVRAIDGVPQAAPPAADLGLAPEHLRLVREGMFRSVNNRRGTAWRTRSVDDRYTIAGKTGTSQVRDITAAERARGVVRNEDLPWERRDHALYVCFAPYEAPEYAVAVVVEHGGGGSTAAAPIGRDVMLRALHGDVPPDELYPAGLRTRITEMHDAMSLRPMPAPRGSDAPSRA